MFYELVYSHRELEFKNSFNSTFIEYDCCRFHFIRKKQYGFVIFPVFIDWLKKF